MIPKQWMVLTVRVPNTYAEAVSNFLIEEGATGVQELDQDSCTIRLRTYFPHATKQGRLLSRLRKYLTSLRAIFPGNHEFLIETESLPDQDWGENWKRFFKPVRITENIIVKPPWIPLSAKRGEILIDIHPGMAFGTGTHSSTKLILRALQKNLRGKNVTVLDVGTGSGILAIAAARLGAKEVWGLDVDGVAVDNAMENLRRNGLSDRVNIVRGSIGSIRKRFDLLLANIDSKTLRRMRTALLRRLKTNGLLIVSGVLERDAENLKRFYLESGALRALAMDQDQEWACLTFKRKRQKAAPPIRA